MSKERDWMDYAQLGLSAVQTAKMSEMASELGQIRAAAADEKQQAQRINQMRNVVMLAEDIVEKMESDASGSEVSLPLLFVTLYRTETMLKSAGALPPINFDSWTDKDRANKVGKWIDAVRDKLLKAMPDDQRHAAELCVKYMAEEPGLKRLVMICSEVESIIERRIRLQKVEADLKIKLAASPETTAIRGIARWGLYLLVGSIVLLCFASLLVSVGIIPVGDFSKALGIIVLVMLLVGCAMYLGQFFLRAACVACGDNIVPDEIRKLESERSRLLDNANRAGTGNSMEQLAISAGVDVNEIEEKFGGVAAEKLRAMYTERRDFVRGIDGPTYLSESNEGGGQEKK